jgi:hypothetical protein
MAELLIKDDKGQIHPINLSLIPAEGIKSGDLLLASYEIGYVPDSINVNETLQQLRDYLQKLLPEGVKIAVIAKRDGKEDISLRIVSDKKEQKKILKNE